MARTVKTTLCPWQATGQAAAAFTRPSEDLLNVPWDPLELEQLRALKAWLFPEEQNGDRHLQAMRQCQEHSARRLLPPGEKLVPSSIQTCHPHLHSPVSKP